MRFLRIAFPAILTTAILLAGAAPAGAALTISAPTVVNLGSAAGSDEAGEISAQLGLVTVTGTAELGATVAPSFIATVSVSVFTTGAGGPAETIPNSAIKYWSGTATLTSGLRPAAGTPGQRGAVQAEDMSVPRVAFSGTANALAISCSWNPTLIIDIPQGAVPGIYTGTITHSVA